MFASTMMDYPLTLTHVLERAGRLFAASEIVSRLPDKSLHRHTYRDFHRRTLALGGANTYNGATTIAAGTQAFDHRAAAPSRGQVREVRSGHHVHICHVVLGRPVRRTMCSMRARRSPLARAGTRRQSGLLA